MSLLNAELYSRALKRNVHLDCILPGEPSAERWRLLILLHDCRENGSAWHRLAATERCAREYGDLVIAMPDAELCWYTNTAAGEHWFDYTAQEIPAALRRLLPRLSCDRADTCIAGIGMGGYGAVKCALTCPETFGGAASLSGALDIARNRVRGILPVDGQLWEDVFGSADAFEGGENDVYALARLCPGPLPRFFLQCGPLDPFLNDTVLMAETLRERGATVGLCEAGADERFGREDALERVLKWMYGKGEEACR